jgi:hypothetical protein
MRVARLKVNCSDSSRMTVISWTSANLATSRWVQPSRARAPRHRAGQLNPSILMQSPLMQSPLPPTNLVPAAVSAFRIFIMLAESGGRSEFSKDLTTYRLVPDKSPSSVCVQPRIARAARHNRGVISLLRRWPAWIIEALF